MANRVLLYKSSSDIWTWPMATAKHNTYKEKICSKQIINVWNFDFCNMLWYFIKSFFNRPLATILYKRQIQWLQYTWAIVIINPVLPLLKPPNLWMLWLTSIKGLISTLKCKIAFWVLCQDTCDSPLPFSFEIWWSL